MQKAISKHPPKSTYLNTREYSEAGWRLVYCALWQYEPFPLQEVTFAKEIIEKELTGRNGGRQAFIQFCERVLLANRLLQGEPSQWVDMPSIWFYPGYGDGFSGTLSFYREVVAKRQAEKGYQHGVHVFASSYWSYIRKPSVKTLKICRKRLLRLKEYALLQLWNNVIILYQIEK